MGSEHICEVCGNDKELVMVEDALCCASFTYLCKGCCLKCIIWSICKASYKAVQPEPVEEQAQE